VVVGLRDGSGARPKAEATGLPRALEKRSGADVVMLLAPDEMLARSIARSSRTSPRRALGFSHGLAIRFGFIVPRADLDVFMVAPKGPGHRAALALQEGKGMVALWAVAQDASGQAEALASPTAARSAAAAPG
jgi:ketol-acid reductoisomerase